MTSDFILGLIDDYRSLTNEILLEIIDKSVSSAETWPDEAFAALNSQKWATTLDNWPQCKRFAIAVDELCSRRDRLLPVERESFLTALKPLPAGLQRARDFIRRFAPEIDQIASLHAAWRANAGTLERLRNAGFVRVSVVVPADGVETIKKAAADLVSAAGKPLPQRQRGRPKKSV